MSAPVTLRTERLLLRPWVDADREPWAALNADPVVMEHFETTYDRRQSDEQVDRFQAGIEERGWGLWAAERTDTGAFIGFVGLSVPTFDAPFLPGVEIGWRLAREHWGQGLAPEGGRAALQFAFGVLGLDEVLSFTPAANRNSRRVMEKLGMAHQPDEGFVHPNVPPDSPIQPFVLYRITADEHALAS